MTRRIFTLTIMLILCLSNTSLASYISLNTTVTPKVEGNKLDVMVSVVNKGDEAAHNVQAEIRVGGKKILAAKMPVLGIDETYKTVSIFKLDFKNPGQYPLVVVMHYADANQYPFSALTVQAFPYQVEAIPSDIFGQIKGDTFWKEGKLKLTLKNMSDSAIKVSSSLVTPQELSVVEDKTHQSVIPAKSERSMTFTLKNFSALSGSTYQVFAISEYEKDETCFASITPGNVQITQEGERTKLVLMILLLLCLIFILIGYFLKRGKK